MDSGALAEKVGELKYILKSHDKDRFYDIIVSNEGNPFLLVFNIKKENICNIFFTNGIVDCNSDLIR